MSDALKRLRELTTKISSYELTRKENLKRLKELFVRLGLQQKIGDFTTIFGYKAINLSALSLQKENFGEIQPGKYLQILAITKVNGKSKNISLGYFGRVENVDEKVRSEVMEFVIRYRFEKSFLTLEHYHDLLENFQNNA